MKQQLTLFKSVMTAFLKIFFARKSKTQYTENIKTTNKIKHCTDALRLR